MTRLQVGEFINPFPAGTFNQLVDLLEVVEGIGGLDQLAQLAAALQGADHAGMVIHVVNKTGSDLHELDIADEAILNGVQFEVKTPNKDTHRKLHVITLEPIPNNEAGRAYLPNTTWARVDIKNSAHTVCGVVTSDTEKLSTDETGIRILWKPTGTGVKWCIISLGAAPGQIMVRGIADGNVSSSDTDFDIDGLTLMSGDWNDTTESTIPPTTLTVNNSDFDWQIEDGDPVYALWNYVDKQWEAFQAKCPT